jgi:hypothetical protein
MLLLTGQFVYVNVRNSIALLPQTLYAIGAIEVSDFYERSVATHTVYRGKVSRSARGQKDAKPPPRVSLHNTNVINESKDYVLQP